MVLKQAGRVCRGITVTDLMGELLLKEKAEEVSAKCCQSSKIPAILDSFAMLFTYSNKYSKKQLKYLVLHGGPYSLAEDIIIRTARIETYTLIAGQECITIRPRTEKKSMTAQCAPAAAGNMVTKKGQKSMMHKRPCTFEIGCWRSRTRHGTHVDGSKDKDGGALTG